MDDQRITAFFKKFVQTPNFFLRNPENHESVLKYNKYRNLYNRLIKVAKTHTIVIYFKITKVILKPHGKL